MAKKLLYLEVDDHSQQSGWTWGPDIEVKDHIIQVVGWFVKEDDHRIVLTHGVDTESKFVMGYFSVLKRAIKKKRVLHI